MDRTAPVSRPSRPSASGFGASGASMDPLTLYLQDISKYALLTRADETDLSKKSLAGEIHIRRIQDVEKRLAQLEKSYARGELQYQKQAAGRLCEERREELRKLRDDLDLQRLGIEDARWEVLQIESRHAPVIAAAKEAQRSLVNHNLRLVVRIAKDYRNPSISLLDLIQAGNEGLMHAARKFDHTVGTPFGTYAPFWIKQRLMKYATEHGYATRVPQHRAAAVQVVRKLHAQLMQSFDREPSAEEIARERAITSLTKRLQRPPTEEEIASRAVAELKEVKEILRILQANVELDAKLRNSTGDAEVGNYFGESIETADFREKATVETIAMRNEIAAHMENLTPREATIVRLYHGIDCERPYTFDEIAPRYGLTRERIRQIHATAIEKMREAGIQDVRD